MGMNVNVLRRMMALQPNNRKQGDDAKTDGDTPDKKSVETEIEGVKKAVDQIENTYTFFSVYEGITSSLGNFYSETLAKMTGPQVLNKSVFNTLYNGTLNNVIKDALERAKSGEKLDFAQLAQDVKSQITSELEACNYDPIQYNINLFSK